MNIQSLLNQLLQSAGADKPARRADMGKDATGAADYKAAVNCKACHTDHKGS